MSKPHYYFVSHWQLPANNQTVWDALAESPLNWHEWWPELQTMELVQKTGDLTGSVFRCRWRTKGYSLRNKVRVTEADYPTFLRLESSGDLVGVVSCKLEEKHAQTVLTMDWKIQTTKPWMNILAPLFKPLFTYNHHAVMRSGEKGFCAYLKQMKSPGL